MGCSMLRCFCKRVRSHHCKLVLLDDHELIQEIQDNTRGQEVLDIVFRHLNLIETAYFGLRYIDASNQTHWLDPAKKIVKQLKGTDPFSLYFGVKFYAADPCKLVEEITRYQFFLQVKQDILQGRLPVTFDEAAELGAYVVQSELGDLDPRRHSPGYVSEFRFLANQTQELESRIEELHKAQIGHLPASAELSFLDKVKWLDMYGVDLHPVLGEDNVEYFLGLTPSGIIVLRNKNKVGHYYWPRISKIYFKGRYFMIRISEKNNEDNTYGFETPSKPACKHLWKCCVEHHAFFRLVQVSNATAPDLFALGSKFRYSGRTEKQAQADAQMRLRSPPQFERTPSRRYQRRIIEGSADVPKIDENEKGKSSDHMKHTTVPLPISSVYRSTCSIPAALPSHNRSESPRSTRSAPWSQPHVRGLYHGGGGGTSPRSVRSAGHNAQFLHKLTHRSPSVDSQSSNDSRSCKRRHRRHRSRRGSDNESEMSKCSSRSHHRHRRRSHSKRDGDSDRQSDQRSHHRHRHKSSSRHRHDSQYELVDSEAQWREVQRRQAVGGSGVHQATVITNGTNRRSGYMNSGMETESEMSYHHKRKQKKHRSRSRSPEAKTRLPDELKKHLEFSLVDTTGMSESQLREIPYTVVETPAKSKKHSQHSPSSKRKNTTGRRSKGTSENGMMESPPPPYTPSRDDPHGDLTHGKHLINHISSGDSGNFSNTGPGSNSSSTSNSALGEFLSKQSNGLPMGSNSSGSPAGSVGRARIIDFKSPSLQNIVGSQYFSSGYTSPSGRAPYKSGAIPSSVLYGDAGRYPSDNWCNSPLRSSLNNVSRKYAPEDSEFSKLNAELNSYKRLNHQAPLTENRLLTRDIPGLPPLPLAYNQRRSTRSNGNSTSYDNHVLKPDAYQKENRDTGENRNAESKDNDRYRRDRRPSVDSVQKTEWRRVSNNNIDDNKRLSSRQQPSPRTPRQPNRYDGARDKPSASHLQLILSPMINSTAI